MGSSTLLLASLVSTVGGLVFGYELCIISGALLQLKAEFGLSCLQQEALVSSLLIGALLASVVGGCLIDRQGCRKSILLSNVLILTGSAFLLISSYAALVLGRIIVGFAMCISSMSCCIFVSEMVAPDRRGFLVTLYETGITVGILAAYATNYVLSDYRRGWKWMFGLAVGPTLLQLVSIVFLPSSAKESEEDLGSNDENQEAAGSLAVDSLAVDSLAVDSSAVGSSKGNKRVQFNVMFQRKDNMRTRTVIGLGLVLFQQFTGQPNVLLYASTIFHSVGFQSDASAVLASVGLGFVKVIATLTAMVFSDRVGRRPLLIGGCAVMALSMLTIGVLSGHSAMDGERPCDSEDRGVNRTDPPRFTVVNQAAFVAPSAERRTLLMNDTRGGDGARDEPLDPPPAPPTSVHGTAVNWIILVCMMAVVSAYAVGFGPMTWLLLTEIYPAAIRGRAFAFTNGFNWAANLLVTFTFLDVINVIGVSGTFLLYGGFSVAAAVFFYFVLPETKGKTLEEIDRELRRDRFPRGDACCGSVGPRSSSHRYQRVHRQVGEEG